MQTGSAEIKIDNNPERGRPAGLETAVVNPSFGAGAQTAAAVAAGAVAQRPAEVRPAGAIRVEKSLLHHALKNEFPAVSAMFKQFVPAAETIQHAEYLGVEGLWGIGAHSFGAVTERRIASIRVGAFGQVTYHDGFLEYVNSTAVYQPSKLGMYLICFFWSQLLGGGGVCIAAAAASAVDSGMSASFIILGLLLYLLLGAVGIYFGLRVWYRFVKCGLVFWIKEGMPVVLFTNRNRLAVANRLYRTLADLRDSRLGSVTHSF